MLLMAATLQEYLQVVGDMPQKFFVMYYLYIPKYILYWNHSGMSLSI